MRRSKTAGFTLVEVAVTIVIVGIGLTLVLQALGTATSSAAQTRNLKLARELGLLTLGRIQSGLYREEIQDRFSGSYAEDGEPDPAWNFEVALGEEVLDEEYDEYDPNSPFYDSWNDPNRYDAQEDEEEEDATQPYEKVKIRVRFPKIREYKNSLILEAWVPWEQVYGPPEDEESGETQQP